MRQAPERVAKMVLLDTSARPEAPEQTERRQKLIALAESGRLAEVNDVLWPVLVDSSRQSDAGLRAEIDKMAEETGAEAFVRQQRAIMSRADSRPLLAKIKCPVMILVGQNDQITPPTHAMEIARGIGGAMLITLAECGHMSAMEKPAEVTELLVDFFAA